MTPNLRIVLAGTTIGLAALALAGTAHADPSDPAVPTPVPAVPADAPAPGQPVAEAAAPPPAPGDAPLNFNPSQAVGRIPDEQAHYGSGSGPLGFLRDAWHQAQDPYDFAGADPGSLPPAAPPPPGAGPAPQLPPGYTSLNAPESNGPPATPAQSGHALPPGYYSTAGPPPPGYFDGPPPPPAPAPGAYVPAVSAPPPPLLPDS